MNREDVAKRMYGAKYSSLSAWGRSRVDEAVEMLNPNPIHTGIDQPNLKDIDREADIAIKTARIRVLEEENDELWQENTELKGRLAQLQAKFHLPQDDST